MLKYFVVIFILVTKSGLSIYSYTNDKRKVDGKCRQSCFVYISFGIDLFAKVSGIDADNN